MRFALTYVPAALLFCLVGTYMISVPGIYMDAVNPDYLVVGMLHPNAPAVAHILNWTLEGTIIWKHFPLIGALYHGDIPLYLGLPFYWFLGTDIVGIRLTNIFFGLIVLASAAAYLRTWEVRPWIASLTLCALCVDPAFLFAWRTEFYITLLPLAPLLASVALVQSHRENLRVGHLIGAGALAGISCYGYFIFGFLGPAAVLHVWFTLKPGNRARIFFWLLGYAVGLAPYGFALALMWHTFGTFSAFLANLQEIIRGLNPGQSHLGLIERLGLFSDDVCQSILGIGPKALMVGEFSTVAPILRYSIFLGLPLSGLALWFFRPGRWSGLLIIPGFVLGLFFLVITFGNRLWLHHFAVLAPLLYLASAIALESMAQIIAESQQIRWGAIIGAVMFSLIIGVNAADAMDVFGILRHTGGVGLSSDAIDRFAIDSMAERSPAYYTFPDWGVVMSFVMLTHGTLAYDDEFHPDFVLKQLCSGRDAIVVLVMGKQPERVRDWTHTLGWTDPIVSIYHQRNGPDVLLVGRWKASARPSGVCDH